ncbi:hypothetical protein DRJ78_15415 [Enterococcus faecalis]|nr:hypothetical protein [Enterococcus faecalis]RTK19208.1 hypothetical protein DRJ93_16465 [Enterococcus faecalis]RTK75855.1 hypothetical protein DRJ78_15415 [Enterococcus faecalis]RTK81394.1 hypothetical protein DRJ71_16375 [Enterococcus faecalis]RTK87715.1 hypothetical protein DRJ77_16055 [Enterococcus faecalis]
MKKVVHFEVHFVILYSKTELLTFFARLFFYISLIFKFFISHSNHSLKSCLKPLIEYCSCSSASLSF